MKLVLVSDIHLVDKNPIARIDDLTETQWTKIDFIFDFAKKHSAQILQAGDLCNKPRSWSVLPRLIDAIRKNKSYIYCCRGQHDDYLYSLTTRDRTILGVLEKAGLIKVLDENPFTLSHGPGDDVILYGCSFGAEIPEVGRQKGLFNVLVIHAPILNRAVYPGQKFTMGDKFLKDHPEFDLIICGDIHIQFEAQVGDRFTFNTGRVVREEATEYNFTHKPSLVLFDTEIMLYECV